MAVGKRMDGHDDVEHRRLSNINGPLGMNDSIYMAATISKLLVI